MTHILLVEDDPAIAMSLKVTCKREGWQMTWLDNASSVLPMLHSHEAQDLSAIIMDVGLPDGDGLSLCQQIRHTPDIDALKDLPIVFLTARSDEVDRILGLEMGGDDYCAKPFSPRELVARLKAIWRREQLIQQSGSHTVSSNDSTDSTSSNNLSGQALTFENQSGVWHYQPLNYSLTWQEQKLELSNTERKVLLTLLQAPNQVFSREQLLNAVSDYPDHRLARTIDSHIKSIRKQLATIDTSIEVIHTHRGLGYALCPA
ncbi:MULTISPECIES: response regulator [Psychrobacter]|jgi:two-component system catabolic regulation response regulator CreB|uniref:DNA-binding response regulator n=1 Tax=Psychrobacter pacificensis TaxID=112002 RepID=A0A1G6VYZ9_9GAMM|nr:MULTISPECIES: response regulator [Psychrobacter]HBL95892.1 DNA-binding response regulator [Psychrobacter sp.]AOY45167.1 DNA-binding response regulator CreB [Psychrobacter sp. AntiMn-1]SDD58788.1 two-component system, OmpR family, catabolic regulation response regulator CreB [Psychrobacter pacificensis]BBI68538.1 DNA-binding response regulator [Psychrobacter sp. KH172YL61]GLR28840.1 DNA-binding response regulator [Psychrobacter pacificensis]